MIHSCEMLVARNELSKQKKAGLSHPRSHAWFHVSLRSYVETHGTRREILLTFCLSLCGNIYYSSFPSFHKMCIFVTKTKL